ncbi:MAG: sensor histidine kinase [Rhodanobacteraceae bacterium]
MNMPRFSMLAHATSILWALGYALWVTNYLVAPPFPHVLDHSLRGIPVFAFGLVSCLVIARILAWVHDHDGTWFLVAVAIGTAIVATFLMALFYELVVHVIVPRWGGATWRNVLEQMPMMVWLFITWVLLYFALVSDAERRDHEIRLVQATSAAVDAQHRLLVQQINPHFLFNALNTVYALVVGGDDVRARRCLLALSAFLRGSIDRNAPREVSLSSELASIRHYLEIELTRFGERLHLDESAPANLLGYRVPTLLLQPLVENCIKHGLDGHAGPMTIWLSASLEQGALVLSVEDDGRSPPQNDVPSTGVGLNNVEERLALLYGNAARLTTHARPGGGFIARVQLPVS